MSSSTIPRTTPAEARRPLLTKALALRFVTVIGASASFFLLLSVVPLYATASSGGGGDAAGLATSALMLATVVGDVLAAPRLVVRYGHRGVLAGGLVLLGAPALVLTASGSLAWIVVICLVRGLGFAFTIVAGAALTVSLIPPERRGEGLALAGVVSGVPSLVALPLGVWLAGHVGFTPVCVAAAVVALTSLIAVPGLPGREPRSERPIGVIAGLRTAALARPTLVFGTTALGAGIVVTFLPLAVPSRLTGLVAVALFVQPAASTAARWFAGRYGDRRGAAGLVVPGLLASTAGMLVTAETRNPVTVIAGVALFGIGFGVAQNATLTLMYARVGPSGYGAVSALWNFAYDAGMGVGAAGFGVLAGRTGYPWAFVLTAALMTVALVPAWRDLRADGAAR
ncbi:MFS transporter [Actinoallomurus purpureus]|uniref:MFS transporter n=1 Tax=Actinoallomurus purpureus TaxID=478114 RepID=UPI0020925E96|nr:MFS transporter [Actinoallomurus purpureus]MCO6006703.1 MFS transporter [Actinoallomurus purpureus]